MKEIYSKDNRNYKLYQKLESKKYRDKFGLYLIEGENLIEEAYRNGAAIESVMVRGDSADRLVKPWMENAGLFVLDSRLFDSLAQTETSQGILEGFSGKQLDGKFCRFRQTSGSRKHRNDNKDGGRRRIRSRDSHERNGGYICAQSRKSRGRLSFQS